MQECARVSVRGLELKMRRINNFSGGDKWHLERGLAKNPFQDQRTENRRSGQKIKIRLIITGNGFISRSPFFQSNVSTFLLLMEEFLRLEKNTFFPDGVNKK